MKKLFISPCKQELHTRQPQKHLTQTHIDGINKNEDISSGLSHSTFNVLHFLQQIHIVWEIIAHMLHISSSPGDTPIIVQKINEVLSIP